MKFLMLCALAVTSLDAQTPAATSPAATSAKPADPAPTPPAGYAYATDGRRDPFVSLVNHGVETRVQSNVPRPPGVAGMLVDEVVVRGIVQNQGALMAMVGSPAGRTYSVRAGDRLMDGSVQTITPQAVVMLQEVKNPMSLEKRREVRKYLRGESK